MRPYATWPLAFVDLETTGLSHVHHDILEIAVVRSDAPPLVSKVKPLRIDNASGVALKINGYSAKAWEDAPTWGEIAPTVSAALNGVAIVGHNVVNFDLRFLDRSLDPMGLGIRTRPRIVIDTMVMAFVHLVPRGLKRLSLAGCCEFLDIETEGKTHRALAGAMRCKRVYEAIVGRRVGDEGATLESEAECAGPLLSLTQD